MRLFLTGALCFSLVSGIAAAGETPVGASAMASVPVVAVGDAFGAGTGLVLSPRWLPDSDPLMSALGVRSAPGLGSVVVEAKITDTRYYYVYAGPQARAIIANDPSAVAHETSSWHLSMWTPAIRPFLAPGSNALYVVRNVPEPTASQPLAQVMIAGSASGHGGVIVLTRHDTYPSNSRYGGTAGALSDGVQAEIPNPDVSLARAKQ